MLVNMSNIYFVVFESVEGAQPAYSFIDAQTFIDENIQEKCAFSKRVKDKIYSLGEVEDLMSEYRKSKSDK